MSLDDAIRMLVDCNRESDEVIEWLERCSYELLEGEFDKNSTGDHRDDRQVAPGQRVVGRRGTDGAVVSRDQDLSNGDEDTHVAALDHGYHRNEKAQDLEMNSLSSNDSLHDSPTEYLVDQQTNYLELFPELG